MSRQVGNVVLSLSGIGFPLTQLAIARFGRRGTLVAEGVSVGLLVRDAAMVRAGVPGRLRAFPALLLRLELAAAAAAAVLGIRPALGRMDAATAPWGTADRLELARRVAVGTLFGLHTWRFRIYLAPDRGRRVPGS